LSIQGRTKDRWFEIGEVVVYCPPLERLCQWRGHRGTVIAIKKIPYIEVGKRQKIERITVKWERNHEGPVIRDADFVLDDDSSTIWGLERCKQCPFRMEQIVTGRCPKQVKNEG